MKAAQRRQRLFAKNKPEIVPIDLTNMQELVNWQWTAYKHGDLGDLDEMDFKGYAYHYLQNFNALFLLNDSHKSFSGDVGPMGYVGAGYDGWNLKPHVEWFPWASTRNRLRCTLEFLVRMRHRKDVGMIIIETANPIWARKLRKYIGIYMQGTIRKGRPDGQDQHTFYIRGNSHGIHQQPARQRHNNPNKLNGSEGEPDIPAADDEPRVAAQH